jgi:hypothetical protein
MRKSNSLMKLNPTILKQAAALVHWRGEGEKRVSPGGE